MPYANNIGYGTGTGSGMQGFGRRTMDDMRLIAGSQGHPENIQQTASPMQQSPMMSGIGRIGMQAFGGVTGGQPNPQMAYQQGVQGFGPRTMDDMRLIAGSQGHPENIRQVSSGPMGHGMMPGMGQQQPIQYASRAGRMRNAARHQNALAGYGGQSQGFGGMGQGYSNALGGLRTGY
jgi:hypothetical protein